MQENINQNDTDHIGAADAQGSEQPVASSEQQTQASPDQASRPSLAAGGGGGDGAGIDPAHEKDVWTGRTSWKHFAGSIVIWVVVSIAVIYFSLRWWGGEGGTPASTLMMWNAIIICGLGIAVVVRMLLMILNHRYRVTTQRLFVERGILSQTIDQTELIRVDDVRVHKSVMDRVLGLGTIEVMSTDATDEKLEIVGVDRPGDVAESIRTNMRQLRRNSLYMENL